MVGFNANVAVIVSTYGDEEAWQPLAFRALESAQGQAHVVHGHYSRCSDLSTARNTTAQTAPFGAEWFIFLDADDELSPGYVDAMLAGSGDVRWPSTLGVVDGVEDYEPILLRPGPHLLVRNHLVIGSMVRRSLFDKVGRFRPGLPILEDWDLWIRCFLEGAALRACSEAVYRVHVRQESRNKDLQIHNDVYTSIQERYAHRSAELVWRDR